MKLADVYTEWLRIKRMQVKESTLSVYCSIFSRVISPGLGNEEVEGLDKKAVLPFVLGMLESGKSRKYCMDVVIVLRMIMRFASEDLGLSLPNFSYRIPWPTKNKEPGKRGLEKYTKEEIRKITGYLTGNPSPQGVAVLLTIFTGMRIGEICALQWKDIDLGQKTVHVCKTMERITPFNDEGTMPMRSKLEIGAPKTASSDRIIPLHRSIIPMVRSFSKTCLPEYYVCSCSIHPIEPRTFRNYYRDLVLNKVKISRCLKFHALRHTFASTLIENKVDVKTASVLLGHSDISTTLNVYVHPSEETKKKALNSGLKKMFASG